MNILVVEKEDSITQLLSFKLHRDGYEVVVATDGQYAVELLEKRTFDLVIADIAAPLFSGEELILSIRNNSPEMPIILLAAIGQESILLRCLNSGANDFIFKPFLPYDLSIRVKRFLMSN